MPAQLPWTPVALDPAWRGASDPARQGAWGRAHGRLGRGVVWAQRAPGWEGRTGEGLPSEGAPSKGGTGRAEAGCTQHPHPIPPPLPPCCPAPPAVPQTPTTLPPSRLRWHTPDRHLGCGSFNAVFLPFSWHKLRPPHGLLHRACVYPVAPLGGRSLAGAGCGATSSLEFSPF